MLPDSLPVVSLRQSFFLKYSPPPHTHTQNPVFCVILPFQGRPGKPVHIMITIDIGHVHASAAIGAVRRWTESVLNCLAVFWPWSCKAGRLTVSASTRKGDDLSASDVTTEGREAVLHGSVPLC